MYKRQGHDFVEAEVIELVELHGGLAHIVAFVDGEDDGLVAAAQHMGHVLVGGGQAVGLAFSVVGIDTLHFVPCPAYFGGTAEFRIFRLNLLPCSSDTLKAGDTVSLVIAHHIFKADMADTVGIIDTRLADKQVQLHIIIDVYKRQRQSRRSSSRRFHRCSGVPIPAQGQ